MTLITFLPHTPFKKKNVLSFLICIVISMGKVETVNVLYKNAIYGQTSKNYHFFSSISSVVWCLSIWHWEIPFRHVGTCSKRPKTEILRIGAAPPGGQISQIFFLKSCNLASLIIPENINSVGSTNKPQSTILWFGKLP